MNEMIPHNKALDFINTVCAQVKCQEVHPDIRLELQSHIDELTEELLQTGLTVEEAVERAIHQMGDPFLLGNQLHGAHKPRTEWSLLAAVAVFIGIGILTMYSLGITNSISSYSGWALMVDKLASISVGGLLAVLLYRMDYRKLKRFSPYLFSLTLCLMLAVLIIGHRVSELPVLSLGFASINFYDVSPILLLIGLSGIFSNWDWKKPHSLLKAFVLLLIPILFFVYFPSVITLYSILLYLTGFAILLMATKPGPKNLFLLASGVIILFISSLYFLFFRFSFMIKRLTAFAFPELDPLGSGYQTLQSIKAIHSAGWWGHGIAAAPSMVPELHTSLAFTYVVYTLGWTFGIGFCMLAVFFVFRIMRIAKQMKELFGSLLLRIFAMIFGIEFFWSILGAVGFAPISANLPFISHGGSQFVIEMVEVGIALSVYRRKDMIAKASN